MIQHFQVKWTYGPRRRAGVRARTTCWTTAAPAASSTVATADRSIRSGADSSDSSSTAITVRVVFHLGNS